jgi:hypothetical protein
MKGIKSRLQAAYDLIPADGAAAKATLNWNECVGFLTAKVEFSGTFVIMQSKAKFASLEQYTNLTKMDMDGFFNEIANLRFISDADKKAKRFALAFVTYESQVRSLLPFRWI